MKGTAIIYTQAELDWIKTNSTRPRKEAHADFEATWQRNDVSISNFKALCKRNGWLTGRIGHYVRAERLRTRARKCPSIPTAPALSLRQVNARTATEALGTK